MKIIALKESYEGEKRVAVSPETVQKIVSLGHEVCIEKGAGDASTFTDEAFKAAGAEISTGKTLFDKGALFLAVRPEPHVLKKMPAGAALVCLFTTLTNETLQEALDKNIQIFTLEKLPRISRAQSMDALSSQSTIAGYAAVILASSISPSLFPMLMTAAGTLAASRVLVLGAGVAGLQAIATAKRLGAFVTGYDIRPDVREQVTSLGAKFLDIKLGDEPTETKGGYAKSLSEKSAEAQQAAIQKAFERTDVVITTAQIPGKKAPILIHRAMLESLAPGSVVVDLAAETGGNCEATIAGQTIQHKGITIMGPLNIPSLYAKDASTFLAKNVFHFIQLLWNKDGTLKTEPDDELLTQTCLTLKTKENNPQTKKASS